MKNLNGRVLWALVVIACGIDVSASCLSTIADRLPSALGLVRNAGQWPDTVVGLYQVRNVDLWFTRSGIISDSFSVTSGRRVGTVTYMAFHRSRLSRIADDFDTIPVTYITGPGGAAITATGTRSETIRCVFNDGGVVQYSITSNGIRVAHVSDTNDLGTEPFHLGNTIEKHQEEVQGSKSSVFVSSSYIGGPGIDEIATMETLPDGSILIAGTTTQTMFPESLGGYSRILGGNTDGFLARVDGSFRKVFRWTFIGGSGVDIIKGISFDKSRRIAILTQTDSYDMPVLALGYKPKSSGGYEAHISIIDSTMSKLEMGAYYGSISDDIPCCISVDVFDDIVIAGTTTSLTGLPTTKPTNEVISGTYESGGRTLGYSFQVPSGKYSGGKSDGFIAIYSNEGQLKAARYYGAEGDDTITAMTTDKRGRIVFAGTTSSQTLTTVPIVFSGWPGRVPLLRNFAGGSSDGFIVKMNRNLKLTQIESDGNFATYFGGTGTDLITAIDIGLKEDIFFVGSTTSNGFFKSTSIQSSVTDKGDAYVGWLRTDGTVLDGFTYWGGSGDDEALAVQADTTSVRIVFGGRTNSNDFPTVGSGSIPGNKGEYDGFIAGLDFKRARYSVRVSGSGDDEIAAFTDAKYSDAAFALNTTSADLPVSDSALMRSQTGAGCYLTRYALGEVILSTPKDGDFVCAGSAVNISWQTAGLADTVRYFVEYRKNGASGWITIAKSIRSKSTTWTVPRAIVPGAYEVRVTTQFGHSSKTSDPITIDINPAVTLRSSPPRDCEGASVRMLAIPANVLATFQWRRNGVNISGATDSAYVITALDAGNVGLYDCVVGGRCSQSDTSSPLEVGVTLRPVIRSQPSSVTVNPGERIRLGVSVDGAGMSYQWYRDSLKIKNATNSEYVIDKASMADSGRYWCSIANVCGSTISNIAVVSIRLGTSVIDQRTEPTFLRLLSSQPVSDELLLECRAPAGSFSLGLNDLMGRQLMNPPAAVNALGEVQTLSVPVSHIEPGLMFIVLQSRDKVLSVPVLLVR